MHASFSVRLCSIEMRYHWRLPRIGKQSEIRRNYPIWRDGTKTFVLVCSDYLAEERSARIIKTSPACVGVGIWQSKLKSLLASLLCLLLRQRLSGKLECSWGCRSDFWNCWRIAFQCRPSRCAIRCGHVEQSHVVLYVSGQIIYQ